MSYFMLICSLCMLMLTSFVPYATLLLVPTELGQGLRLSAQLRTLLQHKCKTCIN